MIQQSVHFLTQFNYDSSPGQDLNDSTKSPLTPGPGTPSNPLPANQEQSSPGGHAVGPAVAARAPSKPSTASTQLISSRSSSLKLLPFLLLLRLLVSAS